jgi:integrase
MSRETSPYIVGDYWLDKRRDGKSPRVWQIARKAKGSILYRSTHREGLDDAKGALDAYVARQRSLARQEPAQAEVIPMLMNYWDERGRKLVNRDQTARSLRTFIGFLAQDRAGVHAVVTDLVPTLFERFREWRMAPHEFTVPWGGDVHPYASEGVSGATVQRNINDVRAAVNHAEDNLRIPAAPKIRDLAKQFRSAPRDRVLTMDEMARIAWYCSQLPTKDMFRFVALQFATAVRPQAALAFDPTKQYRAGLIDLHPEAAPQTKKRNAIVPAIRPLRPILAEWAKSGAEPVKSRKTAWRNMRKTLGLSADVHPKTIRHTIATILHADETVPGRETSELLGHGGEIAATTRIYAKYRPEHLRHAVRALTMLWMAVSKEARAYASDHSLTTGQRGDAFKVVRKGAKC